MRNETMKLVGVVVALMSSSAFAESTVGDLSKIQSETLIIKAKVSRATAQAELEAKTRGSVAAPAIEVDVPVVKNVYGIGKKLMATFLFSSGATIDAREGEVIMGGYKVASLSVDKVELEKGGRRFPVGFSGTPPLQGSPAQSAVPGAPVPPMLPGSSGR